MIKIDDIKNSLKRYNVDKIEKVKNGNHEYEVYIIYVDTKKYILKKINENEYKVLNYLKASEINNVPNIIEKINIGNCTYILYEYIVGEILDGYSYTECKNLILSIAKIHKKLMNKKINDIRIIDTMKDYIETNNEKDKVKIILDKLNNDKNKTLIHDDLISYNVIGQNIIDWEYGSIGCWALDIGRFLGDLDEKSYSLRINEQFKNNLIEEYSQFMNFDINYTKKMILYAEVYNYYQVLASYSKHNRKKDMWYEKNVEMMNKILNIINE